ncbi:MAG: phenylalanine--tRNA ligase subunit alpha, partial [Thermoprotei archaeon]
MSIAELLRSRGLIDVEDIEVLHAQTTEEGLRYTEALPEERLVALLREHGGRAPIQMIIRVMGKELFGIALGWAKRRGWVGVENG